MDNTMMMFYKNALQGVLTDPLCAEYKNEWRKCGDNKERLVMLALRQQSLPYVFTYCYKGKGVSKEYIKHTFKDYLNGHYTAQNVEGVDGFTYGLNVALDEDFTINTNVSAFMWCKDVGVYIPETKCPTIYIGCKSDIRLILGGYNNIRIYLFDESRVTIEDADNVSRVFVYKYSSKASVVEGKYCLAEVKTFDKELRL